MTTNDLQYSRNYLGVAFSGWADPSAAISDSATIYNKLPSPKYISIGGGNSNGRFSDSVLSKLNATIWSGGFRGYTGIVFDIDTGLSSAFATCFQASVANGLEVIVTVSHSAPYGIVDASTVMKNILADPNVKFVSPQLYTSGEESANDYSLTRDIPWSIYRNTKAIIIPSSGIVKILQVSTNHINFLCTVMH